MLGCRSAVESKRTICYKQAFSILSTHRQGGCVKIQNTYQWELAILQPAQRYKTALMGCTLQCQLAQKPLRITPTAPPPPPIDSLLIFKFSMRLSRRIVSYAAPYARK
ncbi:hypothetical protein V9T40_004767 [Parthenolecanium corni]|uniref:Uncharacterized protein n=1 Tax=Parthenolecanium corni TaxID=536013 RepID=A0AAN9Y269_9HEMI